MIMEQNDKTCRHDAILRTKTVSHLLAQHTFALVIIRFWRTVNILISNVTAACSVQLELLVMEQINRTERWPDVEDEEISHGMSIAVL